MLFIHSEAGHGLGIKPGPHRGATLPISPKARGSGGLREPSLSQDNGLDAALCFGLFSGGNGKLGRHRRMGVVDTEAERR